MIPCANCQTAAAKERSVDNAGVPRAGGRGGGRSTTRGRSQRRWFGGVMAATSGCAGSDVRVGVKLPLRRLSRELMRQRNALRESRCLAQSERQQSYVLLCELRVVLSRLGLATGTGDFVGCYLDPVWVSPASCSTDGPAVLVRVVNATPPNPNPLRFCLHLVSRGVVWARSLTPVRASWELVLRSSPQFRIISGPTRNLDVPAIYVKQSRQTLQRSGA